MPPKSPRKPDAWAKALTIANILLTVFTLVYVILSASMLSQMKLQSELARKSYEETLRAQLLVHVDTLNISVPKSQAQEPSLASGYARIENQGNTYAEILLVAADIFPFGKLELDIRDSLLKSSSTTTSLTDEPGRLSKFVPAHQSLQYIVSWANVLSRSNPDGTFYIHAHVLYMDVFKSYHDVYSVSRCRFTRGTGRLELYRPMYNFRNYTFEEIKPVLKRAGLLDSL